MCGVHAVPAGLDPTEPGPLGSTVTDDVTPVPVLVSPIVAFAPSVTVKLLDLKLMDGLPELPPPPLPPPPPPPPALASAGTLAVATMPIAATATVNRLDMCITAHPHGGTGK